ncbi:hypothetical protein OG749_16690 [Streptomyces nojiriensis]|uniref:hypothetical protein n=1 Tax=Streptomyces nojiriensis TaxID=66374 RepID=UPI002E17637F
MSTGPGLGSFSFWHRYDPVLVMELVVHRHLEGDPQRSAVPLAALRRYATAGPLCPEAPPLSAGVITVGSDHRIKAVSPQAQLWLDQWSAQGIPSWIPGAFFVSPSLVARAEARRQGGAIPLVCAPPAASGRWTTCQGQVLDADAAGDVALVVQGATWDLPAQRGAPGRGRVKVRMEARWPEDLSIRVQFMWFL